jgi:branched-chain amino acid transport system substrate-binding protein
MQKINFIPLLIVSFLIAITAHSENKTLGVIIPLSGPYAHFGEAGRIGLELALLAKFTGIKVVYEDSQYEAAKAVAAYTKLVESDKANALIVLGSPPSSAVIPLAVARKIPLFVWTPSKKLTAGKNGVVRLMTSATEQGAKMASEVRKEGYKDIGIFIAQNEFAQSVRDGFLESYGKDGILANDEFVPTEQDFRTSLTRARAAGMKAIGICLNTGQIPTFLNQVKQLGITAPLFGCHALSSAAVLEALMTTHLSAWFVEGVVDDKFQKEFEKKSPDTSGIWLAAAFHDLGILFGKIPFDEQFSLAIVDASIENSAFKKSKITKGADDTYLDVPLGITKMKAHKFIRE